MRPLVPIAALALAGCAGRSEPEEPPVPSALPAPTAEGPVWTSTVVSVRAATPARFSAPISTLVRATAGEPVLPLPTFARRLCAGTGGAREELLAELGATDADGRQAWWGVLRDVDCDAPDFCAWAAEALGREPAATPLWIVGLDCEDPSFDARLVVHAPASVVLSVAERRPLPWDPRLARLHEEVDPVDLERVARVLSESPAPEAARALEDLKRRLPAEGRRSLEGPSALDDLVGSFDSGLDPLAAARRFPNHRVAVVDALETCIEEAALRPPFTVRRCGRALARLDRARARAVVPLADDTWGALDDLLLVEPAEGRARLAELGFEDRGAGARGREPSTWGELLQDLGHARASGWIPRLGDALFAYEVAALAGLDDVEFEVVPPSPEAPAIPGREPRSALFAWTGERRVRTLLDPGFDATHALGLLNALLAELDRPERVAIDRSRTTVVVAPPERLVALADAGLFTWAELEEVDLPVDEGDEP